MVRTISRFRGKGSSLRSTILALCLLGLHGGCYPLGGINNPKVLPKGAFQVEGYLAPGYSASRYMSYETGHFVGGVEQRSYHQEKAQVGLLHAGGGLRYSPAQNLEVTGRVYGPWPGFEFGLRYQMLEIDDQALTAGLSFGSILARSSGGAGYTSPSLAFGSDVGYLVTHGYFPSSNDFFSYAGLGLGRKFSRNITAELSVYRNLRSTENRYGEVTWIIVPSIGLSGLWH